MASSSAWRALSVFAAPTPHSPPPNIVTLARPLCVLQRPACAEWGGWRRRAHKEFARAFFEHERLWTCSKMDLFQKLC